MFTIFLFTINKVIWNFLQSVMKLFYINTWNPVIWLTNFLMSFSMFSHRAIFVLSELLENIVWLSGLHIEIFRRFSKFTKNLAVHEINTKQKFSEPRNICLAPVSVNKPFFNSFLKKRVAVCKDAMVKSLNNVHYVSFVFPTGKAVWHIFICFDRLYTKS